jgi:hypothetical protein
MKRVFSVAIFVASMAGVVGLTRWMPSSPVSSLLADNHGGGPNGGDGGPQGQEGGSRQDRGRRNSNGADLSFSTALDSASTVAPQALIVGAFAFVAERSRRKRNSERKTKLSTGPAAAEKI